MSWIVCMRAPRIGQMKLKWPSATGLETLLSRFGPEWRLRAGKLGFGAWIA
jgi:hypothetical protein